MHYSLLVHVTRAMFHLFRDDPLVFQFLFRKNKIRFNCFYLDDVLLQYNIYLFIIYITTFLLLVYYLCYKYTY